LSIAARWLWKEALRKCGLTQFRFHDIRHTVVTELLTNGAPDAVVRAIVGHTHDSAIRVYSHITESAARAALDRLPEGPKVPDRPKHPKGAEHDGWSEIPV
jgi:integrase